MNQKSFTPTEEQRIIINHTGSAFITACPGAGKTRTLVERARTALQDGKPRRGVAFLSFTNAAVEELEARLRGLRVLPVPLFPSFLGTFDRFLWQFFIQPFGIPDIAVLPRLVPDKSDWEIVPFPNAQPLAFRLFDRQTGDADEDSLKEAGFDVEKRNITAWETAAIRTQKTALSKGMIDFDDVRWIVSQRLGDSSFRERVGKALAARFFEVIVDEAQDCNPSDLDIVAWLRTAGIAIKVICDPHQSIYQFRGGVADELIKFAKTFPDDQQLSMTGNFRSSPAICAAVVALKPPGGVATIDKPLGPRKHDSTPVHILSYLGTKVTPAIGAAYQKIVAEYEIPLDVAPLIASTRPTGSNAIGQPIVGRTKEMTLLLAEAAMQYHFAFASGNRKEALVNLHRTVLYVQEKIPSLGSYHAHVADTNLDDGRWHPALIAIANDLVVREGETAEGWLARARSILSPGLVGTRKIGQRLRKHNNLETVLSQPPLQSSPARTIHSVKGMEFPAVCVVMTTQTSGGILDFIEGNSAAKWGEDARKIYVAASRAERLLVIAAPHSRVLRLKALLEKHGCNVEVTELARDG
ncbi:UvrD-helicase domain-containing protein [Agrobacterium tumefaciens]|nr:UvrD-helicase domain-containing protein [Agrobacterium tumefaciens]